MFEPSLVAAPLRAELARLRVDGRDWSVAELVALVEQCQSVVNQATALQFLAMAHLAAKEDVQLEDGTVVEQHRGLGHQRLDAPALVSDPLGLSDAAASSRMTTAVDVVTRAPAVHDAMTTGRLDGYRAGIVAEELRDAPPEVCREVGARIEGTLGSEPPAALRRRVRRALGAVDADFVRAKAARARAARSLRRWPGDEPGVDTWMGSFPVEQARSGWAVIDGLARQYVQDGRARGVDEARADALMDLIHSRATGRFVVQLAIPADRLLPDATSPAPQHDPSGAAEQVSGGVVGRAGLAERSAAGPVTGSVVGAATGPVGEDALVAVAGLGMSGETHVRREWLERLYVATDRADRTGRTGATQPTRRTVVACHADTGALLAMDPTSAAGRPGATESQSYRPPPSLVELVKARDGGCRFPGCTVSAVFCDLDHVRPWPSGPTEAANLMCLCRRHHRIKQTVRWRVRIEPDATVRWTDPAGRTRTTLPIDFLQLEPAKQPEVEHGPEAEHGPEVEHGPVDQVGVLWSAWEDELAHHLARAERDRRRTGRPGLRVGRQLLHHGRAHHQKGPGNGAVRAGADDPPPF